MEARLYVTEFFTSIQGEGPFCCRVAFFIRLAGCNLRCPFCDTRYSWEPGKPMGVGEVLREAGGHDFIVVTGGEPLLQRRQLNSLLEALWSTRPQAIVQIETNGTLPAPEPHEPLYEAYHVVSPKDVPVHVQGAETHKSWISYARVTGRAWFKLLVQGEEDVAEVARWAKENSVPSSRVYLMPLTSEGMSFWELLELHKRVAQLSIRYGFNFSPRIHLLLGAK